MSGEIARLRPETEDTPAAPALGMSIQVDLGAGRVATLQTFVPSDCSLPDLNRMLDKMTSAGDRQRAHYKIEELERQLEQDEKVVGQHEEDLARVDRDYAVEQAARQQAAENAVKAVSSFEEAKAAALADKGHRGPVVLKGADLANATRIRDGVGKLKAEMANAEAEHKKTHAASQVTLDRQRELIARTKREIARCQMIVLAGLTG